MKTNGLKVKVLSVLLLGLVFLLTGCGFLPKTEEKRVAPIAQTLEESQFMYVDVTQADLTESLNISVDFKNREIMTLYYGKEKVKVDAVYVSKGDTVKEGDLLIEADSSEIKAQINELEARISELSANTEYYGGLIDIEEAKKEIYGRYGMEYDDTMLTEYNTLYTNDNAALNVAVMQYSELFGKLEKCRIYAPFDGVIGYIAPVSERDTLGEDDYAVIIYKDDLYISTMTKEYDYFEIGQTYTCKYTYNYRIDNSQNEEITMNSYGNTYKDSYDVETIEVSGEIEVECFSIELKNESTGTYEIRFIPVGDISDLPTNMKSSHISFELSHVDNALCIPYSALISTSEGYAVYMIAEDGSKTIQNVEIGIRQDGMVEIKSGLELGDQVITDQKSTDEEQKDK